MESTIRKHKVQVIVIARHPDLRVLLLKRPPHRGSIWQPITGNVDPEDRNILDTARRELREETGIHSPHSLDDIAFEIRFTKHGVDIHEHVIRAEVGEICPITLSEEHSGYAWLTPEEASSRVRWDSNRMGLVRAVSPITTPGPGEPGAPPKP